MRLQSRFVFFLGLLIGIPGCGARALVQPQYESGERREYVYFVENVLGSDSRIKKCDIQPDNAVYCTTQHQLEED